MNAYDKFLTSKALATPTAGFIVDPTRLNQNLFPFQRDLVAWSLRRGRAALFCDCGLGKTLMQLEWANQIRQRTGGRVLILAPLAVAQQTVKEGKRFGIEAAYARTQGRSNDITVTNYEMLDRFDVSTFTGVVLDESSILKSFSGRTCQSIIESFTSTPYRLACTATPAPNDYMELGNHSAFLGVMSRGEMLATFFTHDGGNTSQWRLKKHATNGFWKWVCSWAASVRTPSDIGHSNEGYALPALSVQHHVLPVDQELAQAAGMLFPKDATTLTEQRETRGASLSARVAECAEIVNSDGGSWVVWCELNKESEALAHAIPDAVEIRGSDSLDDKESKLLGFTEGRIRVLVTKAKITGFGMNWQHCHNIAFIGVSHSYEQTYQTIRRCWRFGQTNPVNCHMISCETEAKIVSNLERKAKDAEAMQKGMLEHMRAFQHVETVTQKRDSIEYRPGSTLQIPSWLESETA